MPYFLFSDTNIKRSQNNLECVCRRCKVGGGVVFLGGTCCKIGSTVFSVFENSREPVFYSHSYSQRHICNSSCSMGSSNPPPPPRELYFSLLSVSPIDKTSRSVQSINSVWQSSPSFQSISLVSQSSRSMKCVKSELLPAPSSF